LYETVHNNYTLDHDNYFTETRISFQLNTMSTQYIRQTLRGMYLPPEDVNLV